MKTTDQTFIRAYGSDFIPSYADEAARAADYPALAASNVNAVFGSMPRKYIRVDGPAAMPPPAAMQVADGGPPPPLPARPFLTQPAAQQGQLAPLQPTHVPHAIGPLQEYPQQEYPQQEDPQQEDPQQEYPQQGYPQPEHRQLRHPQQGNPQLGNPQLGHPQLGRLQPEHPVQSEPTSEQKVEVPLPHHGLPDVALPPAPAPVALHPPAHPAVPRPHINFAAARSAQPEPTYFESSVEPAIGQPHTPSPTMAANALGPGDGLSVLADSSFLVGSSDFEWPTLHSVFAEPPVVAEKEFFESIRDTETQAEPTPLVEDANEAATKVSRPLVVLAVTDEEPTGTENPPLSPTIANIDKDVLEMDAKAEEPNVAKQILKPAWEVDRLLWPADVDQLYESENEYFRHAGEKLRDASQEGLRVLGVSATHQGEGCTTLAICLARAAAAAGGKVALLDANLRSPQLGTALGLDFARSWHETLNGTTPLAEAAITAIANNITLIPLGKNAALQGLRLDADAVNDILDQAAETFDLVLVDVGVPGEDGRSCFQGGAACPLDAAIIVRDVRMTSEEETLDSVSRYKELGIDAVGIAENFASAPVASDAA